MRSNKIPFLIVEIICVVTILICGFLMLGGDRFRKNYRIYAIVQELDYEDRQGLIAGMRNAAENEDVEIIIVGAKEEIANQSSDNIILREKNNESLNEGYGINIMELDNLSLGEILGQELVEDYWGNLSGKKVDIICKNSTDEIQKLRIDGIKKVLEKNDIESLNIIETDKTDGKDAIGSVWENRGDIALSIDNKSLVMAGEYASTIENPPIIYGIGNSIDSIYLLEKNIIKKLVFPDEYMAGFKSVEAAISKEYSKKFEDNSLEAAYKIITRDNLYDPENEGALMSLNW